MPTVNTACVSELIHLWKCLPPESTLYYDNTSAAGNDIGQENENGYGFWTQVSTSTERSGQRQAPPTQLAPVTRRSEGKGITQLFMDGPTKNLNHSVQPAFRKGNERSRRGEKGMSDSGDSSPLSR